MKCSVPHCSMDVQLHSDRTKPAVKLFTKRKDKEGNVVDKDYISHSRPTVQCDSGMCRFHNLKEQKVF